MNSKRLLYSLVTGLTVVSLFGHSPAVALAASPVFDLEISPPTSYWYAKPGETLQPKIFIKNNSEFTLSLTPELVEFEPNAQGQPELKASAKFAYLDFINPDVEWQKPFQIKPGETKQLLFKIELPKSEPEKEHHLTILFNGSQAHSVTPQQSSTQVNGVMGTNLVLFISPNDLNQGNLETLIKAPQFIDSFRPLNFSVLANNTGLNATAIEGTITITSPRQQKLAEYSLYPDMVLAQSQREVRGILSTLMEPEESSESAQKNVANLTKQFSYHQPFLLGVYTVSVTLGSTTQTTKIVAIPFSVLGLMIAVPFLYAFFILMKHKLKTIYTQKPKES